MALKAARRIRSVNTEAITSRRYTPSQVIPRPLSNRATLGYAMTLLAIIAFGFGYLKVRKNSASHLSHTAPAQVSPPTQVPPTTADKWEVFQDVSEMDSKATITLRLEADNTVEAWLQTLHPDLIISCSEGITRAYVVTGTAPYVEYGRFEQATVRIRFNQEAALKEVWSESTDSKALFSPHPISFARRLAAATEFRFQFTPFAASPVVVHFDPRGLKAHLPDLAQLCHWPKSR